MPNCKIDCPCQTVDANRGRRLASLSQRGAAAGHQPCTGRAGGLFVYISTSLHSHSIHTGAALDTPRPMSRVARPLGAALAACLLLCVSVHALALQPGDRMPDGEPPAAAAAAAAAAFQAAATTDPHLTPLPGTLQTWWCPP